MKRVLIIGAGGFIGGFIAAESLRRGYETWVGVRESTSRHYLTDERLHFVTFDYDSAESIGSVLKSALPEGEKWDWIIYNLGATKVTNYSDFNRINFGYLRSFVEELEATGMTPQRFLYISSLSALGPVDEKTYQPYTSKTIPDPNTKYGMSKIKSETLLEMKPDFPWIIFRPTGVYGPHEKDYLMMIKCIDSHWDFGVGFRKQLLTFIYVDDLVEAMFEALEKAPLHRKYIISEDRAYTQSEFRRIVADKLGKKFVIPLRLPLWMAKVASVVAEKYGILKMKPSTLNSDKYKIMKQRNWSADISDSRRDFGFNPKVSLEKGIELTVEEYRSNKNRKN